MRLIFPLLLLALANPIDAPPVTGPQFERVTLTAGRGPGSIEIADVNGDGHADLLVVNTDGQDLSVFLGDGHGHFRAAAGARCPTGPHPNDIAIADFNGDGHPDLAIADTETPNIAILLGDGRGGFHPAPHCPFAVDSHPHVHGVAAADFNGDGKPDVATDDWGRNQIRLLLGDGMGNLVGSGQPFRTGKRPYERVRSADFNGDKRPDVVTTNLDENTVSILLGDGKGGLHDAPGSPFPAGVFPWGLAIGDFNSDGEPDLAVIPYDRDIKNPRDLGVTVLLNDGKGGFAKLSGSPFSLAGCRGPDRIAAGDIDGDERADIALSCAQNDRVMLFLNLKEGGFQRFEENAPTGWSGLAVADLNGDGKADIAVSGNTAGVVTLLLSK